MASWLRGLAAALLLVTASCSQANDGKNMSDGYEWVPTETAPEDYPVFLITGLMTLSNGDAVIVPDERLTNNGWGKVGSVQLVEPLIKPMPADVELKWYSFSEDKAYRGRFPLPQARMATEFHNGVAGPDGKRINVSFIQVGMAPGGDVAVWLGADRVAHLVGSFRAAETGFELSEMAKDPAATKDSFVQEQLGAAMPAERLKAVREAPVPVGAWGTYDVRYAWVPRLQGDGLGGDIVWLRGINGEMDWFDLSGRRNPGTSSVAPPAPPKEAEISWAEGGGHYLAEVSFDAEESRQAFAAIKGRAGDQPLQLVFSPADREHRMEVLLRAGEDVYRFTRCKVTIAKL